MAIVHLHLLQGQTFRRTFVLQRPGGLDEEGAPLPPVPLETIGATGRMQLRTKYGEPVLLELTTENGGISVDPEVDGRITLFISDEETDALGASDDPLKPRTKFQYDLELTLVPSGDVIRVMESDACTIRRNITRDVP